MKRLMAQLLLPPEITAFERQYLRRMNRIALLFFAGHIPVFAPAHAFTGVPATPFPGRRQERIAAAPR